MKAYGIALSEVDGGKWKHYALALISVWFATLIRFPVQPVIGDHSPFLFYIPVVLVIAFAFGLKPGLLATAASVVPANYYWMVPERTFSIDLIEGCQMLAFSIIGCSVSWLSETSRKRKQLEDHLRATIATMEDAIITVDRRGRIVYLNAMAQVLTELHLPEAAGSMIGSALDLQDEDHHQPLNAAFQIAVSDDEIEKLPDRVTIVSRTGKRYPVEHKISRIMDARGRKLGMAMVFHRPDSGAKCGQNRISTK